MNQYKEKNICKNAYSVTFFILNFSNRRIISEQFKNCFGIIILKQIEQPLMPNI